jgi:hypothetical protein
LGGEPAVAGDQFPIEVVKKAFLQHYWPELAGFAKKIIRGIL